MKTKIILTSLLLVIAQVAFCQHPTESSQPVKSTTTLLLEQHLTTADLTNNLVRLETVIFPPGYSAVSHQHPCPLFVYVLEGELLSEFEGQKKVYKPGDTFYEKANGVHSITKNNSDKHETKLLVIYLTKEGMNTFVAKEH